MAQTAAKGGEAGVFASATRKSRNLRTKLAATGIEKEQEAVSAGK